MLALDLDDDQLVIAEESDEDEENYLIIDFDEAEYAKVDVTTPLYTIKASRWVLPRLHRYERGKRSTWRIGWCDDRQSIVTIWGYDVKQTKMRHIDDSSVASARDRAFPICCTKFLKQQRFKGYHTEFASPDTTMKPMRGYEYHEGVNVRRTKKRSYKSQPLINEDYPVIIQPKLDGIRCISRCNGDIVTLRSRTNKAFANKAKIRAELKRLHFHLPQNTEVDGEFYKHGSSLQDIMSIVTTTKTVHQEEGSLLFHVFDCLTRQTQFLERWHTLRNAFARAQEVETFEVLRLVNIVTCYGSDHLKEMFDYYVAQGYEGLMIRFCSHLDDTTSDKYLRSLYVEDRCHNILKYKVVSDEEGKILAIQTLETGEMTFLVVNEEGIKFAVSMAASHDERKHAVYLPENIGRMLTYEYRGKTKAMVPKHAVGKCIRYDDV